ncbi:hypothetical protein GIB67_014407, partial [Kingdonia uniflora]
MTDGLLKRFSISTSLLQSEYLGNLGTRYCHCTCRPELVGLPCPTAIKLAETNLHTVAIIFKLKRSHSLSLELASTNAANSERSLRCGLLK